MKKNDQQLLLLTFFMKYIGSTVVLLTFLIKIKANVTINYQPFLHKIYRSTVVLLTFLIKDEVNIAILCLPFLIKKRSILQYFIDFFN